MTTSIIGVGNLGGTVARHLVEGGEAVVLAALDEAHAQSLADELGPNAGAASVEDAVAGSDTVVLATWLDQSREYVPGLASALENKVVVDPSNPIGFENGQMIRTLPEGESSGSVVASMLPASADVLFYATDDDVAEATARRLISAAGFEPLTVGGASAAGRIEGPDGELQGQIFDLDEARATIAPEGASA
jgi:hypothetical protein